MATFDKKKPVDPFGDFCDKDLPPQIDNQAFGSPDARFGSTRKIGRRTVQIVCPECGHMHEIDIATYDMKTGQKTFMKEMQ